MSVFSACPLARSSPWLDRFITPQEMTSVIKKTKTGVCVLVGSNCRACMVLWHGDRHDSLVGGSPTSITGCVVWGGGRENVCVCETISIGS